MQRFNSLFKIGTKVKIDSLGDIWHKIKCIHETRKWIEVEGWVGSWQRGHVIKFTNK
jgi:hypothetical protein